MRRRLSGLALVLFLSLSAAVVVADEPRELTYRDPHVVDFETFPGNTNYHYAAVGDVNDDGRADVVLAGRFEDVRYLAGTPDGGVAAAVTSIDENNRVPFPYGMFEAVDVDGDGDDDVVAAPREGARPILVFRNDGGGVFTEISGELSDDILADTYVLFDLGDDGDLDLMASVYRLPSRTDEGFRVFENVGTSFVAGQRFLFPSGPAPRVADVNDDGLDDLVIARATQTVVFRQTPEGTLAADAPIPHATGPIGSAVIDVDDDGDDDVIAYGRLLRNDGTGVLTEEPDVFLDHELYVPVVVDFDNDGLDDIVVHGTNFDSVELLRNTGGAFAAPVAFGTGLQIGDEVSFTVEDVDENGLPDLVVVDTGHNAMSILRQTGNVAPQDLAVTPAVIDHSGIAPLDLVGSGFADGATVDLGAGIVTTSVVVTSPNAAVATISVDRAIGGGERNVRLVNPDGQVTQSTVEVHSLDATAARGRLKDSAAPAHDVLRVKGRLARNDLTANAEFAGRLGGLRIEIGSGPSRLVVVVPAGDPRWTEKARGRKLVFETLPEEFPRIRIAVDTRKETFSLEVSFFDYPQAPADASLRIVSGDDLGRAAAAWAPQRGEGRFRLR